MGISLFENTCSSSKAYAFYSVDFGVTSSLEMLRHFTYLCMWAFKLEPDLSEPLYLEPRRLDWIHIKSNIQGLGASLMPPPSLAVLVASSALDSSHRN